jgi:DNA invertase Pin-like site-specific DNA recombinase
MFRAGTIIVDRKTGERRSGLGLEAQRQGIAAFCALKGLRLTEVFEDAGVSGGRLPSGLPSGARLLAAARRGKTVVIVAKLDRLFRSVADAANVIADFDRKGIELIAIAEGFDMTTLTVARWRKWRVSSPSSNEP